MFALFGCCFQFYTLHLSEIISFSTFSISLILPSMIFARSTRVVVNGIQRKAGLSMLSGLSLLCTSATLKIISVLREFLSPQLRGHQVINFSFELFTLAFFVHRLSHPSELWSSFLIASTLCILLELHFCISK